MKKIVGVILAVIFGILFVFTSCTAERTPTERELAQVSEIFNNLCDYYDIEDIPLPTVKIVSARRIEEIADISGSTAVYLALDSTIYVSSFDTEYAKSLICHELVHYLNHYLTNDYLYGIDHVVYDDSGTEYKIGYFMTEGLTQYFAGQVYPFSGDYAAYPFELMIGEQLDRIFDRENKDLFDLFIHSKYSVIKNFVDNRLYHKSYHDEEYYGMNFTPFDQMCQLMDNYSISYINSDTANMRVLSFTILQYTKTLAVENEDYYVPLNNLAHKYSSLFGYLLIG